MFDVESSNSVTSETSVASPCFDDGSKPVSSSAHDPAGVNTVEIVVGGFRKQLLWVDPEMIESCGCPFDDPLLEVLQVSQLECPGEPQIDQRVVEIAIEVPQLVFEEIHVFQAFHAFIERFPPVLTGGEHSDLGQFARTFDFNKQDRAPAAGLERVRLGRATVPATLVYAKLSVPVAERQVVQPGKLWPFRIDWVGPLILSGIEAVDGAMR